MIAFLDRLSFLKFCVDKEWLPPEEAKRLRKELLDKKSAITTVAEEVDAMKQELSDVQKQRINSLLNRIDQVVPILPKAPQCPTETLTCVKQEPNL